MHLNVYDDPSNVQPGSVASSQDHATIINSDKEEAAPFAAFAKQLLISR